jgi:hypothetical protein
MDNEFIARIQVGPVGNFYTSKALPPSFRVKVVARGMEFRMMAPVTDGNCNYCHSPDGFMNAAGRIVDDSYPPVDGGDADAQSDRSIDASGDGDSSPADSNRSDAGCSPALYLMIDNRGSMDMVDIGQTVTRWDNVAQAIPAFANDPLNAGTMVGLDFFPEVSPSDGGPVTSCDVVDYTMTNVPVDMIPGPNNAQSDALVAAVQGRARAGGSPTTPALTGALQAAKVWQMAHPDRALSVVFLTDGQPTSCGGTNTVPGAAAVAQMYASGLPPIRTYVLGIGPDTGNLDSIAAAGGTQMAYMLTDASAAAIANALRAIVVAACPP